MKDINLVISKAASGDAKAQRQLYEAYRTRWFMTCMRYGKNKMQSEDIFQEGLINVFKNLASYNNEKAAFNTWSTRVFMNTACTFLKKHHWAESLGELEEARTKTDDTETIYQKLSAKELTSIIQKLPIGYRLVFNMYVIEGYKHKEIAQLLGISEGTSKSQLFKAKQELRKNLERQLNSSNYE